MQPAQVCSHLERLTSELEAAAHPALDALTSKVSLSLPHINAICLGFVLI